MSSHPVRQLSAADVHLVIDWARQEGWNPGIHDAACFQAADPEGFFASLHAGEPAAVVSVVRYGSAFAFLGLYICRPDLRGQGYGLTAWSAGLDYAGARTIGLDGVPEQQPNYRRSGFALAWRNRRYEGVGGGETVEGVVDLDTVPFAAIAASDAGLFEADRRRFLRSWIAQPDATRLGVIRDGRLAGWGLLRRCATGRKIGPLVADDAVTANRLLDAFLGAADPGEPVFLDVPEPNAAAVRAAEARGMTPVFETARMYRGTAPALAMDRIWGITTFELG
jgi:hypothetical protein